MPHSHGTWVVVLVAACLSALWAAGAGVGRGPDTWRHAYTSLHAAARTGDVDVVRRLVDRSRASGRHGTGRGVDCRDGTGASPLHYAATAGHGDVVRMLIAAGADPCAADVAGWTPLHWAAASVSGDNAAVASELLPYYPTPDVTDEDGSTPLHLAARRGDAELVRRLIAAGANLNARDGRGQVPLHEACQLNRPEVAEALARAGADLNARDHDGVTPLGWAGKYHASRVTAVLRRLGAKV